MLILDFEREPLLLLDIEFDHEFDAENDIEADIACDIDPDIDIDFDLEAIADRLLLLALELP